MRGDTTVTPTPAAADPLSRVLAPEPPPFALLHRPQSAGSGRIDVLLGEVSTAESLADVPLRAAEPGTAGHDVLVVVPYRQIAERGYACPDDGEPLMVLTIGEQSVVPLPELLRRIPDVPIEVSAGRFDIDDDTYGETVRRVVADEIGRGEGANFVMKRTFVADIADYTTGSALAFFRRLLEREQGAYWTFIVHTGRRTFVGATPERHVSLSDGIAVMNPISGTYRYPPSGPTLAEVIAFLSDRKEADELYMVVDEELKMMARVCDSGARVVGPHLKEMARVAHTEYFIEGRTSRTPLEILKETMFAPTVTGSPLESACRVIAKYEPEGRGYYSGVVALIGRDGRGGYALDSSILIRTADIDASGRVRIGVGATLVRKSDPASEAAETRAKAAGLLGALGSPPPGALSSHPKVRQALESRNATISGFWLGKGETRRYEVPELAGRRVLIVDAEDTFTAMIDQQLRALGLSVTVRRFDEPYSFDGHDLVVMGPGPGDPRDTGHPKIDHLRRAIARLLDEQRPFLAVCLSHQVLCTLLGLRLARRKVPNQGVQKQIDLFGRPVRVGFYNTFAAHCDSDKLERPGAPGVIEVCRDAATGEVHALRGPGFRSMQFHAESVLTEDGPRILSDTLVSLSRDLQEGTGSCTS